MFTGLISDVGTITGVDQGRTAARFQVTSRYDPNDIPLGASIAHDGCCLTVIKIEPAGEGSRYLVEVSRETLSVTALGRWQEGTRVNLERSLRIGDELGGHLVTGHVDGVGSLLSRVDEEGSWRLDFSMPHTLAPFIARKGSIAVQGVSLTVNDVTHSQFGVSIIPHTADHTNLGELQVGDPVNLEIDLIARYIDRQKQFEESET